MKPVGILRFLGTNCDDDICVALDHLKVSHKYIWWADRFNHSEYRAFVLPGGFSYGDYLRAGALAALSPAMEDLKTAAGSGAPVLGICNGFQILCESRLLQGTLTKNTSQKFQEEWVELTGDMRLPIAHSMGRFIAREETLDALFEKDLVWLKYKNNPNGSLRDIAGIKNEKKNVRALMPHPERAMHDWMGSTDGLKIFEELLG